MYVAGFPAGSFQANCYVVAPAPGGECVVIDPGEDSGGRLAELLAAQVLRPAAVLLTHGHLDHTAGAAAICDDLDIPLYIHPADDYMLDDPLGALSPELRGALAAVDLPVLRPGRTEPLDAYGLQLAGLDIGVLPTPGHTGGSVVFAVGPDADRPELLFTGDTLFAGSIGRTDLPGGSYGQIIASITDTLLTRDDEAMVLPGHGPTSTIGAERRTNPFLTD